MKVLQEYKKSIKIICRKCGYPVTAKKGSEVAVSGQCSPCKQFLRVRRMDWKAWRKGHKKSRQYLVYGLN